MKPYKRFKSINYASPTKNGRYEVKHKSIGKIPVDWKDGAFYLVNGDRLQVVNVGWR